DQGRKAAVLRGDRAQIHDRGIRSARNTEAIPPRHEIIVSDVMRRGEEAACVDPRIVAEQNAVWIDQKDAPVSEQRSIQERRTDATGHTIEHYRTRVRLSETRALAAADVECLPVDDRALRLLPDRDTPAPLPLDRGRTSDDLTTQRIGYCRTNAE